MNTPLSWIKAYVPELQCTEQEYMDAMTMSGTKVEGYEKFDKNLDKIIVGKIEKIEKHPDADKLVVCQVAIDEKGTTTQIVTGASNVKEGQKVPVVLDGGRVAGGNDGKIAEGGIKIKKGKLRGVESNGMMCSIGELGSSTEFYPDAAEDGIYILSDNPEYKDAPVGSDAIALLGLRDANSGYIPQTFCATGCKGSRKPGKDRGLYLCGYTESGTLFPLCSQSCKKYQTGAITRVDAAQTGSQRNPSYQQYCRYYKLCHGRVRTANACL